MRLVGQAVPVEFGMVAPALHIGGWRPIPLYPNTKQPAEAGWTERNVTSWTESDLAHAVAQHYDDAAGIAVTAEQLALDLDIRDAATAQEVERIADRTLGETPLQRIGLAPKSLRVFRSDGSVRTAKRHPIEVFAGSGQVAVFGWHAGAGRPYSWPVESPLAIPSTSKDLPVVTARQLAGFMSSVAPLLSSLRRQYGRRGGCLGRSAGETIRTLRSRGLSLRDAAKTVLGGVVEGGRHDGVLAVVSAAFNSGFAPDDVERLIRQTAPRDVYALVTTDRSLDRALTAFAPKKTLVIGPL